MLVILTGAIRNVGDYLIGHRAKELISQYADSDIVELSRFQRLDDHLDVINSSKALVLCGGPAYGADIYPGIYPLVEDLGKIEAPIVPFGLGWSGMPRWRPDDFTFTDIAEKFVKHVHAGIPSSSCRDYVTKGILERTGIANVSMTGCPAWYSLDSIGKEFESRKDISKIVFTTPASPRFAVQAAKILQMIRRKFPEAQVYASFHRGILPDRLAIKSSAAYLGLAAYAKAIGCKVVDVAYDMDKIAFYGDCDLHVGYRVHGHLYFLSKRIPSLLINEDGRGLGMAQAMQLPIFLAHKDNLSQEISQELDTQIESDFGNYHATRKLIDNTFIDMKKFLQTLSFN